MYGLIKTHKGNNLVGMIISGRGTAMEYLSIFAEKYLYKEVNKINSKIMDTPFILNLIDSINNSNIGTEDSILC